MPGAEQELPAPETLFPVKFIIGSRQVLAVPRQLRKISFSLVDLVEERVIALPPVTDGLDGYRILSAPAHLASSIRACAPGFIAGGRQNYRRHFIDMSDSFDDYLRHFSARTRSTLQRKQRKLERQASASGGGVAIREFRTPDEVAEFMTLAAALSRRTYQARMLDAGLPEDEASRAKMMELAARDDLRCFLLLFCGQPISYLFLPVDGNTVIYAFLGYDEQFRHLSPGTVLHMHALERLFAEKRYRYFDFTEGDGPHKAMFGNRSVDACSLFLLRATPGNRLLLAALKIFDSSVAAARAVLSKTGAHSKIRQALRRI